MGEHITYREKWITSSILMDAFSHNISSHTLSNLTHNLGLRHKLWRNFIGQIGSQRTTSSVVSFDEITFLQDLNYGRSYQLRNCELISNGLSQFKSSVGEQAVEAFRFHSRYLPLPIDDAIQSFLEYLQEKSSFLTCAIQENVLHSTSTNWFDLLRDFIKSPLMIGSMVYTEGVRKVKVLVQFPNATKDQLHEFAEIDVSLFEHTKLLLEWLESDSTAPPSVELLAALRGYQDQNLYEFLRSGRDYLFVRDSLKELPNLSIPGGKIGRHAFFTLLENTLRNVKHLEGCGDTLRLVLSIRESHGWNQENKSNDTYEVGVWLHHEQENLPHAVEEYHNALEEAIVDSFGNPRFGGSSLDKICSSILLTNQVYNYHLLEEARSDVFSLPYIAAGGTSMKGEEPSFLHMCLGRNRNRMPLVGVVQKFFRLWKSDPIQHIDNHKHVNLDALVRSHLVSVSSPLPNDFVDTARSVGVIRIVSNPSKCSNRADLMKRWLGEWLALHEGVSYRYRIACIYNGMFKNDLIGVLGYVCKRDTAFDQASVFYLNQDEYKELLAKGWSLEAFLSYLYRKKLLSLHDWNAEIPKLFRRGKPILDEQGFFAGYKTHKVHLTHGGGRDIRKGAATVHSHTYLLQSLYDGYMLGSKDDTRYLGKAYLSIEKRLEFLETLFTPIYIFDNQVHSILSPEDKAILSSQFCLHIHSESILPWKNALNPEVEGGRFCMANVDLIKKHEKRHLFMGHKCSVWEQAAQKSKKIIGLMSNKCSSWLKTQGTARFLFRNTADIFSSFSLSGHYDQKMFLCRLLFGD